MENKICTKCLIEKNVSEFYPRKEYGIYRSHCKVCTKAHLDSIKQVKKEYDKKYHAEKRLVGDKYQKKREYEVTEQVAHQRTSEYNKKYRETHKEQYSRLNKLWRANNLEQSSAKDAKRRASYLKAIPVNQTIEEREAIRKFYLNRPKGMHVDHIVPLQGVSICGKHELKNLQYLTKSENTSKGNKFPYYPIEFYKERGLIE